MVKYALILIFLGTAVLYRPVLTSDFLLSLDDIRGVTPLQDVHSVSDYFEARKKDRIWDVQPVRDISYLIDLSVKDHWSLPAFHGTNLLLWWGILVISAGIFGLLGWNESVSASILLLMAFHPLFVDSVGWVSARKHLLAAFFLALATFFVLRIQKTKSSWTWGPSLGVALLFTLALYSHPISFFWLFWAPLFWISKGELRRAKIPLSLLAVTGFLCVALNFVHYHTTFIAQTGGEEHFFPMTLGHITDVFLSWGRYFLLLVWPTHLLIFYYEPTDSLNKWGLLLLAFCLGALLKFRRRDPQTWLWLAYVFGGLSLATVPNTNIFVSDTYWLVPSLGVFVLLGSVLDPLVKKWQVRNPRGARMAVPALVFLLLIPLAAKARSQITRWVSDENFCRDMYFEAPNPQVMSCYGMNLLREGRGEEALRVAGEIGRLDPDYRGYGDLLAKAVESLPAMPLDEKIRRLESAGVHSAGFSYSLSRLYAKKGDFQKARDIMIAAISNPAIFAYQMKENLETIMADMAFYCRKSRSPCDQEIKSVQDQFHYRDWNRNIFEERLKTDEEGL